MLIEVNTLGELLRVDIIPNLTDSKVELLKNIGSCCSAANFWSNELKFGDGEAGFAGGVEVDIPECEWA